MFGFLRILLFLGILFVGISAAAVGWPMVSGSPRPPVLEDVARAIRGTPLEQRLTDVLGASTDAAKTGFSRTSSDIVSGVRHLVSDRIGVAVGAWSVEHILPVYDSLPEAKREMLRAVICQPEEATGSSN